MVASLPGQVDGVRNPKVQSIFLDDMPIHQAAFASGGSHVRLARYFTTALPIMLWLALHPTLCTLMCGIRGWASVKHAFPSPCLNRSRVRRSH